MNPLAWFKSHRKDHRSVRQTEDGGLEVRGYSVDEALGIYKTWLRTKRPRSPRD